MCLLNFLPGFIKPLRRKQVIGKVVVCADTTGGKALILARDLDGFLILPLEPVNKS